MFSYLQGQRVNLQLLQESASRELLQLLERIEGTKAIVLDDALLGPIGLIASPRLFPDREIKLLKLEKEIRMPKDVQNIIYIARPLITVMDVIAGHVKNADKGRAFHIFFVPRRSCLCVQHLENVGVYGRFGLLEELTWNFYPMDRDVISMECETAFRDLAIDGDPTSLYQAAVGLVQLQRIYGRIPKIYGKGTMAQGVWERAKKLGAEEKLLSTGEKGTIDQIILLDRQIDLLSCFATQLTYEGLIDEFFGIRNNQLTMPADLFAKDHESDGSPRTTTDSDKKTFILNSGEELYSKLRNKNFNEVGKILSRNAKDISAQMNAKSQDNTIQDMKRLVDILPALLAQKQSVANHTTIAELIRKKLDAYEFTDDLAAEQEFMMCEDIDKASSYIEDLIAKKVDFKNVLRLMCIQCAAASGFKEKVLNYYKRELAHVYGIEVLLKISNLEKAGVLYTQSESRAYAVLRKTLNLTVEDVIEVNPKDISYVHSFYAPLMARIVEQSLKPLGWQSLKSQINNLPGPTFEDFQAPLIGIGGRHSSTPSEGSALNIPRVVMIFIVGGCTFAEIAALRFLAHDEDNHVQFVIATTKIINKNSFLDSLLQ